MADNRRIGIFDSGVGGLTILSEIKKLLPSESFIYLADQANVPYGAKTEKELKNLTSLIVSFLISKNVKTVIAACNTATVYAINHLRLKFNVPIIGVVPVVKTIAEKTQTGKIAVFSTPATAKSKYLERLIKQFAKGKRVYKVEGGSLEKLIEEGRLNNPKIDQILEDKIAPLMRKGVDSIALGCTHYPFIRGKIEGKIGKSVNIYDSGLACARRVKHILTKENILSSKRGKDVFYTTGNPAKFKTIFKKLTGEKIDQVLKALL
jgi:glutamate racemase